MNRIENLAARLAGIMAELDPYGDTPAAAEYAESLKADPLNTVESLTPTLPCLPGNAGRKVA